MKEFFDTVRVINHPKRNFLPAMKVEIIQKKFSEAHMYLNTILNESINLEKQQSKDEGLRHEQQPLSLKPLFTKD